MGPNSGPGANKQRDIGCLIGGGVGSLFGSLASRQPLQQRQPQAAAFGGSVALRALFVVVRLAEAAVADDAAENAADDANE